MHDKILNLSLLSKDCAVLRIGNFMGNRNINTAFFKFAAFQSGEYHLLNNFCQLGQTQTAHKKQEDNPVPKFVLKFCGISLQ